MEEFNHDLRVSLDDPADDLAARSHEGAPHQRFGPWEQIFWAEFQGRGCKRVMVMSMEEEHWFWRIRWPVKAMKGRVVAKGSFKS